MRLELEPRCLWTLRRPIFGWGSAQVLGCAAVLTGGAVLAGVPLTLAVVAALGLALSSTAIALQVVQERNLVGTAGGQAGFSILLFQDVAAIPILALLPLLAADSAQNKSLPLADKALGAIKIASVIGGVVLGGRTVLRRLLRAMAKSGTPEIFTAGALLLVVAVDDVARSLAVVDLAREHFPHLKLVARARDVTHWNALRDRSVTELNREMFESSLNTGQRVLRALGLSAGEAQAVGTRSKLIAVAKQGRQQLEAQMARERAERGQPQDHQKQ